MTRVISALFCLLLMAPATWADSAAEKREKINQMSVEVLERLYKEAPETRDMIKKAEGYGVFSNIGVHVIFLSGGGGSGVVVDNKSGGRTYMNMGTAGLGLGLGVKDFRGVFIFHSRKALDAFVEKGWDFSGQADAAAKSGEKGGEGSAAGTVVNGASIYQLTETGLALQVSLQGTKYWKSDKLNTYE